jgi:hypothetical protein
LKAAEACQDTGIKFKYPGVGRFLPEARVTPKKLSEVRRGQPQMAWFVLEYICNGTGDK